MSKLVVSGWRQDKLGGGAYGLPKRHPACRRRELTTGLTEERGNLSPRCKGKSASADQHKCESTEGAALSGFVAWATRKGRTDVDKAKPLCMSKREVWEAYKRVRAGQGAAGVDGQTLAQCDKDLSNNLYRIWNRSVRGARSGI